MESELLGKEPKKTKEDSGMWVNASVSSWQMKELYYLIVKCNKNKTEQKLADEIFELGLRTKAHELIKDDVLSSRMVQPLLEKKKHVSIDDAFKV